MKEEGALHPYPIGNMPHRKVSIHSTLPHPDYHPLEELGALPLPLLRPNTYLHCVTRANGGDIGIGLLSISQLRSLLN